jgi:hypothetical protein
VCLLLLRSRWPTCCTSWRSSQKAEGRGQKEKCRLQNAKCKSQIENCRQSTAFDHGFRGWARIEKIRAHPGHPVRQGKSGWSCELKGVRHVNCSSHM